MICKGLPNGLRYLRWGGDGEAVQPEKSSGVGKCLRCAQNPQRQVPALLARVIMQDIFVPLDAYLFPVVSFSIFFLIINVKSPL